MYLVSVVGVVVVVVAGAVTATGDSPPLAITGFGGAAGLDADPAG